MNTEIINTIKSKMDDVLNTSQLNKLESVLKEVFNENTSPKDSLQNKKNLIKQFINSKKIEGCSKRTEEYYFRTLTFFEKNINSDINSVTTAEIRDYLLNYQKINNCTNVTLDTVRRILSSFYKWLEDEDFIIKSPMKTMATRAIDKGMPIEQVQVLLGHTKIDTTLRYANVQQVNVKYSHQKFIC